jgi:hypothetical protein
MAGTVELDIAGLEGNMMAQPRIFAHDAINFEVANFGELLVPVPATLPSGLEETVFMQRGACLYVGVDVVRLEVEMESGSEPIFLNIPAGSFLPILVTKINAAYTAYTDPATNTPIVDNDIVILW